MLPLSSPIRGRDGKMINELVITKGMAVLPHFHASNVDKALWGEDAAEWRPERWLAPLPAALEDAHLPGVYSHLSVVCLPRARRCVYLNADATFLQYDVFCRTAFLHVRVPLSRVLWAVLTKALQRLQVLPTGDE